MKMIICFIFIGLLSACSTKTVKRKGNTIVICDSNNNCEVERLEKGER